MKTCRTRICGDRAGVALILVIGMLALMMVMGVTFAIFMRSERTAAGNFRADVQNRELLQVALGRALDAIEGNVGNTVYPSWDILQSTGSGGTNQNALAGSVTNWIPASVIAGTNVMPQWVSIPSQAGQYSWVVLNCSGLLDVNNAGGGDRASGTNVSEIQLSALSEVGTPANVAMLAASRPYETLQELGIKAGAAISGSPQNLVTYSNFPTNYTGGADLALVDLSGDITKPERQASIIAALQKGMTGAGATDPNFIYKGLLYYVDPSPLPLNTDDLGTPLSKSVPMINEVSVTNYGRIVNGNYQTYCEVDVEWFYPFVKQTAKTFNIVCDIQVDRGTTDPKYVPASKTDWSKSAQSVSASPTGPGPCIYGPVKFLWFSPPSPFSTGDTVKLSFKIGVKVTLAPGTANIVDSVPYPYTSDKYFTMNGSAFNIANSAMSGGVQGFECMDSRFNWNTQGGGSPPQWMPYTAPLNTVGTMGGINYYTKTKCAASLDLMAMYLAGEPLHNVGELAFLMRTATQPNRGLVPLVNVFTNSATAVDRVLDYFYISQVSTNRRGFANVNSRSPDVLKSVFTGLLKEAYPGAGGTPVSTVEASRLATALMAASQTPISRMSDYGTNTAFFSIIDNPSGSLTPFQQQAVLRESADLFHYRQNLFVILLYGRSSASAGSGIRAVAEIWRDPVANSQGCHPWFLRQFKQFSN